MPSSYTNNLRLEKPATGEQAGVWGVTVNTSYDFLDQAIDGSIAIPLSASAYTLSTGDGTPSSARNKVIVFTGALGTDGTITIAPNTAQKIYFVSNQTTGGFALNFVQGTGKPFVLQNGYSAMIYSDGLGGAANVGGALSDLQVHSLLVQTNLMIQGQIQWGSAAIFSQLANFQAGATISAPLTINLGGDAPFDLYYRASVGQVARLGIGSVGQVLTATSTGPSWMAIPATGIGSPIAAAAPNQILYADASSLLGQNAALTFTPGVGVGIGMTASRALSIGRGLTPTIHLDSLQDTGHATPAPRALLFTTNGVGRWVAVCTGDTEQGFDSGSNFSLSCFSDQATQRFNFSSYRSGRSTFGVYSDSYNAQLAVANQIAAQDGLVVRGAVSQTGFLQQWQNSAGTTVASIDNAGNFVAAGSSFVKYSASGCIEAGAPAAVNHPRGTLHLGVDTRGVGPSCCIALEQATGSGDMDPTGKLLRLYHANGKFIIQYYVNGVVSYAYLIFGNTGPANWGYSQSAP